MAEKTRVLLSRIGYDIHERAQNIVAEILRNAGFEVIHLGIPQTPETIANTAIQEDVDIIGISSLSHFYTTLMPKLIEELRKRGVGHIPVVLGGNIWDSDKPWLEDLGISGMFGSGTPYSVVAEHFRKIAEDVKKRKADVSSP